MKFPPYPRYKDSGIEWLGEVPEHWEVVRNKAIFKEVDERSSTGDEELLTVSHITGVTPRSEKEVNMFLAESLEGYKKSKRGDLIINTMWAFMGALGLTDCGGVVSPSYNVYRLRTQGEAHPKYLDYLYRTPNHIVEILRFSKGIWDSRLRLYPDAFLSMRLALPPYKEQEAIVEYLDCEMLKIAELIGRQERLIALLQEKRQALISHAVTKGLNPNEPHKDSGIAWFGEIPEHWEAKRLKWLSQSVQTGGTPSNTKNYFEDGQIDWYTPGDFVSGIILKEAAKKVNAEAISDREVKIFPAKSVLIVGIGTIGKIGLIERESSSNQQINAVIPQTNVHGKFLAYSLSVKTDSMLIMSNASTIGIMNQEKTKQIPIAVPPLAEQKEIAEYLDRETAKIDALTGKARQAIELLKEHRTALISSAVTGKIDVRQYRNGDLSNN